MYGDAVDEAPDVERLWQVTAEHSPVGMTLVSPQGEVLTANRALCVMLRCEEGDLVGTGYEGLTHAEDRARHERLFADLIAGRCDSYRLTKQVPAPRRLGAVGRPVGGVAPLGDGRAALRHRTAERRHPPARARGRSSPVRSRSSRSQRRVAQAIVDTVDVGLVLVDADGHIEDWNRQHADFMTLAFPDGHHGEAGQQGRSMRRTG